MTEGSIRLSITFFFLLSNVTISASQSQKSDEIISRFMESSNRTITFISIDESITNCTLVINQHLPTPRILLSLNSSILTNCSNYANVDFYDNEITLRKFKHNCMLHDFLYLVEFSDFLIFTPSQFIALILKCIVQPLSRYLVIVTATASTLETSSITHILNATWRDNGALKVTIVMHDKVITFDPFHRNDDGSFGKLNTIVAESYCGSFEHELKNLNGYPIAIEMFPATYTMKSFKGATSLDDFSGPDADIAKEMRHILNATSK
jgi:hypothetical protein